MDLMIRMNGLIFQTVFLVLNGPEFAFKIFHGLL
ncbi:hypothetical protein SAMN06296241_1315 [Salinimicrobium sediminis]|uniref:Uncharacterized protein n=1 Tax=Salinimicrobium sediminis TaxID=1343891 RepID=A0A285X5T9_9FLAO|nr:hypothetical protein SAMN06296241_1315 [Salinimicrobium sediminis]